MADQWRYRNDRTKPDSWRLHPEMSARNQHGEGDVPAAPPGDQPWHQSRRTRAHKEQSDFGRRFGGQETARRARARLMCGYGCPCCGTATWQGNTPHEVAADTAEEPSVRPSLAEKAAAVDGSREAAYVDTHVHLEMVLQKIHWFQSAPSITVSRWEGLTENEQQCWGVLGFKPSMWGSKRTGSNGTWFKSWTSLSPAEQSAAWSLGWSAARWNACEWLLPKDVPWRDLTPGMRGHLEALGETCASWDEMFGPCKPAGYCDAGDMRTWRELTIAEREAAAELGFSPGSWDMTDMCDIHAYVRDFCGSGFEACITQGCDEHSIDDCVRLAQAHPRVFASFGCHPKNAYLYEQENMEERVLAAFSACGRKAVAWGEFGLDFSNPYYWDDSANRAQQITVFERQLHLGLARNLPLVLHIREAADDALRILRKWVPKHWTAHIHAFHGSSEFVEAILATFPNFYFGITGTVGMGMDGDGVRMARLIPLDRMLLETDGPYMLPRGTVVNHVGQIPLIGRLIAEVLGLDASDVMAKARANTRYVYGL